MLANQTLSFVGHTELKDFHEFLWVYADIFTKNVYSTKDYTYKNLKNLIEKKKLVLKRSDYDKNC